MHVKFILYSDLTLTAEGLEWHVEHPC